MALQHRHPHSCHCHLSLRPSRGAALGTSRLLHTTLRSEVQESHGHLHHLRPYSGLLDRHRLEPRGDLSQPAVKGHASSRGLHPRPASGARRPPAPFIPDVRLTFQASSLGARSQASHQSNVKPWRPSPGLVARRRGRGRGRAHRPTSAWRRDGRCGRARRPRRHGAGMREGTLAPATAKGHAGGAPARATAQEGAAACRAVARQGMARRRGRAWQGSLPVLGLGVRG